MKKIFLAFCAAAFLAFSGAQAQTDDSSSNPKQARHHTRPPYSGPRKGSSPYHQPPHSKGKKQVSHAPPQADHVTAH